RKQRQSGCKSPRAESMSAPPEYSSLPNLRSTSSQIENGISIDLVCAAQKEANFLRMIDRKAPLLYEGDVVRDAIRRYEQYWLPLQAIHPNTDIIPPLDVHWIWHCHMLSPLHYDEDCISICGRVIDHKLLSSDEIQKRYESSLRAWDSFCAPEPYDFMSHSTTSKEYIPKSKYDLISAVQRQRNFNYQVSLPHYTSTQFLTDAVKRYIEFLLLKQTYPDQFLTPAYDFDLIWHTHQVHPLNYSRDCISIFGCLLKHDDSVNDRSKNSKLLKVRLLF
ncbi:hypothetical protein PFISCL1PPCAC_19810, partial [Pristionchus fissidentatus]